jgi:glycosyltransferase involved in cell wall biosynthesis
VSENRSDLPNKDKLRVAYLFQNIATNFSEPYAAQLHILHTLYGLQKRGHHASLMALQPRRRVVYTDDLEAVTGNRLTESHFASPGRRDGRALRFFESGVRNIQSSLHLPYLALFDDIRMYEAACRNISNIHLIHERYSGVAVGGALASKKLGIPFILEVNAEFFNQSNAQGAPVKGLQREVFRRKTRYCFDQADKIICVSEQLRTHLVKKWNLPPEKTITLECAADVDAFGRDYDAKSVRRKLNLDQEPVVIWIGGFYVWHDLDLLLESFSKVVETFPQAKLLMVGDGKNRSSFERTVRERGFERSVMTVGLVEHAKIPELLSIADVAVAPAPLMGAQDGGTGAPLKLFEYMAAGKAIIASDVYQSASVIQDGVTGIMVEPGNVHGFAEAIIKVLSNKEERDRLARNARQRAVDKHSWEHYTELLEDIYRDVLQNHKVKMTK